MDYEEVLSEIKNQVNLSKDKIDYEKLRNCIICLKRDFNKTISTDFLKSFIEYDNKNSKNTKICYILKGLGLKTEMSIKYFKEMSCLKYNAEVVDYSQNNKGEIFATTDFKEIKSKDFIAWKFKPYRVFVL